MWISPAMQVLQKIDQIFQTQEKFKIGIRAACLPDFVIIISVPRSLNLFQSSLVSKMHLISSNPELDGFKEAGSSSGEAMDSVCLSVLTSLESISATKVVSESLSSRSRSDSESDSKI